MDGITQILMIMFLQYVYQKESDLDGTSLAIPPGSIEDKRAGVPNFIYPAYCYIHSLRIYMLL